MILRLNVNEKTPFLLTEAQFDSISIEGSLFLFFYLHLSNISEPYWLQRTMVDAEEMKNKTKFFPERIQSIPWVISTVIIEALIHSPVSSSLSSCFFPIWQDTA